MKTQVTRWQSNNNLEAQLSGETPKWDRAIWRKRGRMIELERKELGLSREYVATKIGISVTRLRKFEIGKGVWEAELIQKACEILFQLLRVERSLLVETINYDELGYENALLRQQLQRQTKQSAEGGGQRRTIPNVGPNKLGRHPI